MRKHKQVFVFYSRYEKIVPKGSFYSFISIPSFNFICLSDMVASSVSCVTITNVCPSSSRKVKNNWCNSFLVRVSRFPEGSSAKTTRPPTQTLPHLPWKAQSFLLRNINPTVVLFLAMPQILSQFHTVALPALY